MNKFAFKILVATFLFAATPILAQNVIRPKITGPGGLYVNSYNGVLFFSRTDMQTGNSAMPMELTFYYNSSSDKKQYGYGLGFSLGYEIRYSVNEIGSITVIQGDGRSDLYQKYGHDYEAPAGVFNSLTQYETNKFCLIEKSGNKYYFDDPKHRKLTSIVDPYGNKTTLTYQDSLLVKIVDAVGHTVNLSYIDGLLSSIKSSFHSGELKYQYDGLNRLRKLTDAMGNTTLYEYNNQNRIDAITDANGHKTLIAYNSAGMVSRMKTDVSDRSIRYEGDKTIFIDYTTPQNLYSYYRWDENGRAIEKVGLCCGIQSKLEYDDDNNVIRRTDANGNATTYTYDDRGNMLSMTDPTGNTDYYTYSEQFNQVTSFTDRNGNTYRFSYNDKGSLTALDGPLGFSNTFTYNEHGWPLTTTDANRNVTATTYKADGTILSVMDAAGNTTSYEYDNFGNITAITDANQNTTTYSYDENNRMVSETDALGNTTTVSYDKVGNAVRIKDAKNQITAYTYNALGNVLKMTNPAGGTYTYTYDGNGNVLSVVDPLGIKTTQTWNEKNMILSQTNGEGESTFYDYDSKGNLVSIFQPNGNVVNYSYDQLDRVSQISDNMGIIARYTYDGNGNQLTLTDGLDRTVTYRYDALNRKISETLPSGAATSYSYDLNSNLISVTDAKNNVTTYTYNSLNQQLTHTDALNAKTVFEYDANGNMSQVTDANGNPTAYEYDAMNRNTQITFANGASLQYTYDELGRVIISKDRAGNEFKYSYDALGNLLSKVYPDKTSDKYTYDGISRMLTAVNNAATVTFTYDHASRLLSETLNGKVTGYKYDVAAGKRTLTYPSGMKVEEHLNARDLISSIFQNGEEVVTMEYNAAGQKTKQAYANGITTTYTYNENGWLDGINADHDVMNYKMVYDAVGNITERQDLLDASRTESYGYDVISQLTSFKRGTTIDKTYQFDLLGNRIKTVENGVVTNYTSNNVNAYTSITGGLNFTPTYDGNGNMLNDDKHQFKYDYNNKLVSVDENMNSYKYDAFGRRIAKNTTDGNITYIFTGNQMVEVFNYNTKHYLFGNNIDEILRMSINESQYFFHANHLSSISTLSNGIGQLVERVEYDAYGKPMISNGDGYYYDKTNVDNNILFSGREYDFEISQYHYRMRTMSPLIGRFMQKDPLSYIGGMNDYSYVKNYPIISTDPFGLFQIKISGANLTGSGGGGNFYNMNQQGIVKTAEQNSIFNKKKGYANKKKEGYASVETLTALGILGIIGALAKDILTDPTTYLPPELGPSLPAGDPNHGDELYWYDDGNCIENYPGACNNRDRTPSCSLE